MAENTDVNQTTGVTIGALKERAEGETRVSLIPDSVRHLVGKGLQVVIESGAGEGSSISDEEYREQGATVVDSAADVIAAADVVTRVQAPGEGELEGYRRGQMLVSFLAPLTNHELDNQLADAGITAMAVDQVPRISRAQSMDALSAMGSIGGYKAVLLAAAQLPKFFPLLMTAAGTIRPARVLVIGAGVAGLQAIATARRLGAVVDAYDTRPVVKEQVESLGANFVQIDTGNADTQTAGGYAREATAEELQKQQEGLNEFISKADVVITTAAVPGRPAPKLIPAEAVANMRHGSVIVDLAAETGGNCELTQRGEVITEHGVTIIGVLNLPATLPVHASQMYAKVITNFLDLLIKDGQINLNMDDEIIRGMTITHNGEVVQEATRKAMGLGDAPAAAAAVSEVPAEPDVVDVADAEEVDVELADGDANGYDATESVEVVTETPVSAEEEALRAALLEDESDAIDESLMAQDGEMQAMEEIDGIEEEVYADASPLYDEENPDLESNMTEPAELDDVLDRVIDDVDADPDEVYTTEFDESALADTTADEATAYVEEETKDE